MSSGVLNSSTRSSAGQRSVSETDIRVAATAMRLAASTMVSAVPRSEEHTSELQSLMRISYAVFCLKKKKTQKKNTIVLQTRNNITIKDMLKSMEIDQTTNEQSI